MTHKNIYQKLGNRISQEVQLLAEEKWIVDALTKIKNQRNCLQIERLHLENLKSKLKSKTKKDIPETITSVNKDSTATTSAINMMQHVTTSNDDIKTVERIFTINDAHCNEEELNLMVTEPVFVGNFNDVDFNLEEDEEESDDDMLIEMNMLMNGMSQKRTSNK